MRKTLFFLIQSITVGLAFAFILVTLRPELLGRDGKVVEFHESDVPAALSRAAPFSYATAVEVAAPAIVNINTAKVVTQKPHPLFEDPLFRRFFGEGFGEQRQLQSSLGSGVVVSPKGYILTNNHVVEGADEIQVGLRDGRTALANVVGTDPEADLAVLKVQMAELPTIVFGDSDHLRVGDVVLAIGNPFGVGQTVTLGIVSATGRNQLGINTFENFIQTDAAINPGNSGGALINPRGELIGINTAIFSRTGGNQGIGFAIPISLAKESMRQIIEHGHVRRGWLGVEVQEITQELAESFGLKGTKGVIVAGVLRGGPADQAGLEPGDVLTRVDDTDVAGVHETLNRIAQIAPGTSARLHVLRDRKALELEAQIGERPVEPR